MNLMTYKGYHARVDYDGDDEVFIGHIAGINDVIGFHADTVDYVATCANKSPDKPYSGRVMFRVDPILHARAARAADLAGKSLNQWAEEALELAASKSLGNR